MNNPNPIGYPRDRQPLIEELQKIATTRHVEEGAERFRRQLDRGPAQGGGRDESRPTQSDALEE